MKPGDAQLEGGVDEHGGFITVAFTLPAGSFATVLLRELMKNDAEDGEGAAAEQETPAEGAGDEHNA